MKSMAQGKRQDCYELALRRDQVRSEAIPITSEDDGCRRQVPPPILRDSLQAQPQKNQTRKSFLPPRTRKLKVPIMISRVFRMFSWL